MSRPGSSWVSTSTARRAATAAPCSPPTCWPRSLACPPRAHGASSRARAPRPPPGTSRRTGRASRTRSPRCARSRRSCRRCHPPSPSPSPHLSLLLRRDRRMQPSSQSHPLRLRPPRPRPAAAHAALAPDLSLATEGDGDGEKATAKQNAGTPKLDDPHDYRASRITSWLWIGGRFNDDKGKRQYKGADVARFLASQGITHDLNVADSLAGQDQQYCKPAGIVVCDDPLPDHHEL